jgi:hypothetical protein
VQIIGETAIGDPAVLIKLENPHLALRFLMIK